MKFRPLLFLIIPLILTSCRGREVVIPNPFEGERLVMLGRLETDKPIRIQIGKTFPPIGYVPEAPWVNDAKVEVYKNGDLLTELTLLNERGVYGSDIVVETGQTYVIKAKAEGIPEAETEKVWVSDEQLEFSYQRIRNAGMNYERPLDLIRLTFQNENKMKDAYWAYTFLAEYEDGLSQESWPSSANILSEEEGCTYGLSPIGVSNDIVHMGVINGNCISSQINYDYFIPNKRIVGYVDRVPQFINAQKMIMRYGNVPKEAFEFGKAEQGQPGGLDILLLATQNSYTNIKNGYGLVYALNLTEITLN